jgi:signal transduction histidine kinase
VTTRKSKECRSRPIASAAPDALEVAKLAALGEFAAGAGHEINNPLTVIVGRAQLLLRGESDPERRRDLAVIVAQAMRITEMIADLRLFATCPAIERQSVEVVSFVRDVVESLRSAAEEQNTTLNYSPSAAALQVIADPIQLTVALRALCQNALEALGASGRVEVAVASASGEARISVSDDGPGIQPEQRAHIFEPFYSARQAGRGVGMGLSKCWRIVTEHGGHIEVESRPGCGAVFTICLPLEAKSAS